MKRYFGGIRFTIEADNEERANLVQEDIRELIGTMCKSVVDVSADEPVEFDEFGHAGKTLGG